MPKSLISKQIESLTKKKDFWHSLALQYKDALIVAKKDRALFARRLTELQNKMKKSWLKRFFFSSKIK